MTQKQLGDLMHLNCSAIAQWEIDLTDPNIENLKQLAIIFDVTTDYILDLEDESGRRIYNNINNGNIGTIGTINNGTINNYHK